MTPPIAILGAGPSGLLLGRLLELAGISFIIFERDKSESTALAENWSGTLDIRTNSGQIALQEAGLLDQFKSIARYDVPVKIADASGKVYVSVSDEGSDPPKPEIDRRDLRSLLLSAIPAERVRWDCKVVSVRREFDESMSVQFANGHVESGFRLVIGADGVWSKVRSLVTSAKPQYCGVHYLTTRIKSDSPFICFAAALAGKGLYIAMGDEKQVLVVRLGDGSYQVAAGVRLPETWSSENADLLGDPSALTQWLVHDVFAGWSQIHKDVIQHSDGGFRDWPLYGMPTEALSWQNVPGVALIGDAAHVTPPFVGEGVNNALIDSLQLAQQIVKHGLDDLDHAVSEYEALMFTRGVDHLNRSRESGKLSFASDAPRGWLKAFAGIEME